MKAEIPYKWPLSLDLVKQTWDANTDQRLLAFYSQFFDKLGPNLEQKLLGGIGYVTIDPENVEALLSTRFEGKEYMKPYSSVKGVNLNLRSLDFRLRPRLSKRRFHELSR